MPFVEHNRILANGTFDAGAGVGAEIFTFSLADSSGQTPQEVVAAAAPVLVAWFHLQQTNIPSWATLRNVRCESVGTNGKIIDSFATNVTSVGDLDPTVGAAPAICSFCITLETAATTPKGGRVRGRFYPPNTGWYSRTSPLGAGDGIASNIANNGKTLVDNLNAAGLTICVASATGGGQNATVTAVSATNLVDTQRRRKNHATDQRATVTI